jgi:CRISPR-associated endoribonuclease Cas6
MRFKLHLKPKQDKQKLLFNYQYPLQAWLYRLIQQADSTYADWLHNQGLRVPNSFKAFKHFTFSSLQISDMRPPKQGDTYIQLGYGSITLIVSFFMDATAENFIIGLFQNQEMSLYNREVRADFIIERVETLETPDVLTSTTPSLTLQFRTISPMVVAKKSDDFDQYQYLSPADVDFAGFFALNLIDRIRSIEGTNMMKMDVATAQQIVKFRLLSAVEKIKKRGFTVKEGKLEQQTKVIGYHNFSFEITAPVQLLTVGYFGGFGRESAMGCGCVEILENRVGGEG